MKLRSYFWIYNPLLDSSKLFSIFKFPSRPHTPKMAHNHKKGTRVSWVRVRGLVTKDEAEGMRI